METVYITGAEKAAEKLCAATVGFFDGVHAGHRHVIGQVMELARQEGLRSCVVTFEKHPRQVVAPDFTPQLLTTLDEKLHLLDLLGVEVCAVLRFDSEMAAMDAETFMQTILARTLGVRHLVIGYDNRFGHGRTEGFADYAAYGKRLGMTVTACNEEAVAGEKVSSSLIRRCLAEGDVEKAAASLGYCYTLAGRVVGGFRQGRKMGFPTANIDTAGSGKLLPAPGAYAVRAWIEEEKAPREAMMNIGTRPTFHGHSLSLEVHVLGFEGDLYGRSLRVDFMHRLREERTFHDAAELTLQLQHDRQEAIEWFEKHP